MSKNSAKAPPRPTERRFAAEAAYAQSIFLQMTRDGKGCVDALRRSVQFDPSYAPAILALGSAECQLGRRGRGLKLLLSLLDFPGDTEDLCEIIDKAGDFLIQEGKYADGLRLYRRASRRFPRVAVFHQGIGCCAGHEGLHAEAIAASRSALDLEPDNQRFVNDLGWSLHEAGQPREALSQLRRAVAMDPRDKLAAANLRFCESRSHKARPKPRRDAPGLLPEQPEFPSMSGGGRARTGSP